MYIIENTRYTLIKINFMMRKTFWNFSVFLNPIILITTQIMMKIVATIIRFVYLIGNPSVNEKYT